MPQNLKKKEIESYLEDVHGVAGKDAPVDVLAKLVEGDFDPEEYDKHMQQAFGDDYYNAQDDMEVIRKTTARRSNWRSVPLSFPVSRALSSSRVSGTTRG